MVHVLRQTHKALNPHGVLLDVHPVPRPPSLEIRRGNGRLLLGYLDWTNAIASIRGARARLSSIVAEGLFRVRARRYYDLFQHFTSVEAWLRRRKDYGEDDDAIPPDLLARVRSGMMRPENTLVITERFRATVLSREQGDV